MSKKQEFIKYVKELQSHCDAYSTIEMNDEARLYWEAFCGNDDIEKPMFTDNGKLILKYLQDNKKNKASLFLIYSSDLAFLSEATKHLNLIP